MIRDLRLGIADHLGWAIAVTASADHEVVDRRRIALVEPGVSAAPIHYESRRLDVAATAALVARVRASVDRACSAALDDLARALPAPYEARADAIMYRHLLAELAHARGWEVHCYDAKHVEAKAADLLGNRADEVLRGPRATLGPPWTKDHRVALAATVVAGAELTRRRRRGSLSHPTPTG